MRINFTRLGLILIIVGAVLLFNFLTANVPESTGLSFGYAEPDETLSYSLYMAPVGLGNLVVGGETVTRGSSIETDGPSVVEFIVPVHLVVVGPSDVTLIDVDVVTPYTVSVDFNLRGKYTVHATNMGDESVPIPVSLKFPRDGNAVYREADKFFVGTILTVSGVALFCLGLFTSLIIKHKRTSFRLPPSKIFM